MTSEPLTRYELWYVEFKRTNKNNYTCDYHTHINTLQDAIRYEHWDVLKLIESEFSDKFSPIFDCLAHAIAYGKSNIFTWLLPFIPKNPSYTYNHGVGKNVTITAAYYNQFQCLKLLKDHGVPWKENDTKVCELFAEHGNLEALQWCRSQGCLWDESTCNAAAEHGHLHILEWCQRCMPPCKLTLTACSRAAEFGHLHILKWLKDNGKPWNPIIIFCDAGSNGQMHIVKWIISQCGRMHAAEWRIDNEGSEYENVQECEFLESFIPVHINYNANVWYQTYSLRGLWITQINESLAEILSCHDLETLIKNYI